MERGRSFVETSPAPKILICTPTYLTKFLKGPRILDATLFQNIKHIILDEVNNISIKKIIILTLLIVFKADMLLEGDYLRSVEKIMDAFKVIRRDLIAKGELKVCCLS